MKRMLIVCLFGCLASQAVFAGQFLPRKASIPGTYIVRLNEPAPGTAEELARDLGRGHGFDATHVYSAIFTGFAFRGSEAMAKALARNPHVLYVEEAFSARLTGTQSPAPSWGLDRIDQRLLPLNNSYTYPETGAGSTIYIVDSGVNAVSDLTGRIVGNWNYVSSENRLDDCVNHGTLVATIAAGTTYGVAKGASIVNYRAFDCSGYAGGPDLLAAINDLTNGYIAGTKVVANFSWISYPRTSAVEDAVTALLNKGVSIATAAGYGIDSCTVSPAALGAGYAGLATVSSSLSDDSFDGSAGVGMCIDILAPTYVNAMGAWGGVGPFSGTSASVPHVSGALALLQQRHGITDPAQLETILKQNATPGVLRGMPANTPNLLLHTSPSVPVTPGASLMYASQTTTASVAPVAGASYAWTIYNGTLTGGQGTPTATFRAGCNTAYNQHVAATVAVTTASGTTTGMSAVSLLNPLARTYYTTSIQPGQSATIPVNLFGQPPWTLTWSNSFMQTVSSTPAYHTVSPASTTYYRVVSFRDGYGCFGTTEGYATVHVVP